MFRASPRRAPLLAVAGLAALSLMVAACSSSKKASTSNTTTGSGTATTTAKLAPATINGSGSTFQQAFNQDVIQQFMQANPGVTVTYAGGGSGKGLTDLQSKLVDYAGTDAPIPTADLPKYGGAQAILYFPTVAAPITLSYNVPGLTKLTLTAPTIAGIFSGKITTWNDPAIAADNSGVSLPSTKITPVHRSDSSGTTNNFTLYLTKAAPADWPLGTGKTVNWTTGLTGNGNGGVAQAVKSTSGAIGYVDYSDAKASGLNLASVKNAAGKAQAPSLAGASAAIATATINPDLTYDPINAPGPDAYPITSPTWIVIYTQQTDQAKGQALKGFLNFILTTGQKDIATQDDFAPLSPQLQQKAQAQLSQIVIP
ncbi:MAG TPA: phosphate ABC transporter substrate-binding protein PstS [Acidimicrobiales bacterium]